MVIVLVLLMALSSEGFYRDARNAYKKGSFDNARKKFERFLIKYPKSSLTPYALYWAGRLREKPEKAIECYEKILNLYLESKVADNALYRLAQYYYIKEDYKKALKNYKKIISSYPEGDCAEDAKKWISIIFSFVPEYAHQESGYTIQVGAFLKKERAERLKKELAKFNPYIIKQGKYYKIRLGNFRSLKLAKEFMLEKELKGFVVKQ
ncbi:SPOR domain-containing protein [candidate division WOR-3 bacterium]|nr:SPOR domain-containing protein [candidate division WOR-3 bacterium]